MKIKLYLNVCLFAICLSCTDSPQTVIDNVYKVDLEDKIDPFDRIFSKAEIISLETSDSCLVAYMQKVYPIKGKLYIYDFWLQNLNVFDHKGNFIRRIGKRGQGPREYLNMYDCYVDVRNEEAYFLSLHGIAKCYGCNGEYKGDIVFPARPHYYSMSLLDDDVVTWSCLEPEDDGCILLFDRNINDTIASYWHDDRMFNNQLHHPFHLYDGKTYFSTGLRQQVYEVTTNGLLLAYIWDFGEYNIKESRLDYYLSIENPSERNDRILDDYGTESLPFCMQRQCQNARYSYVSLQRAMGMRPPLTHVFYDKTNHRGYAFDELADGCRMNYPLYFGEDFILTDVFYENREQYKSILPESEYKKLENMKEDDNPCLLKLYFK